MTSREIEIDGIYCCECGVETPCLWEDLNLGKVFQCPACKAVYACVYPQSGGRAWIKVSDEDVKFHGLIKSAEEMEL